MRSRRPRPLVSLVPTAIALAVFATGCVAVHAERGSGVAATETRDLPAFSNLEIEGSPDVFVEIGDDAKLEVTTDDNLLASISTEVEGDTLRIGARGSFTTEIGVSVRIRVPTLSRVEVTGSGDTEVRGLDAATFEVRLTGSGDLRAVGRADAVEVMVTGSGDVDMVGVDARAARVRVTGSGDVGVRATDRLEASVLGSGDVTCTGSPDVVDRQVLGSGEVRIR